MESFQQLTDVLLKDGGGGRLHGTLLFWGVLIAINIPVYILYAKLIFGEFAEFMDAIGFWLKPDIFSLFDGSHADDFWAEMKLFGWVALSAVTVVLESRYLIPMFLES